MVLRVPGRSTIRDHRDCLRRGVHPHRKEPLEIERANCVVRVNGGALLKKNGACIDPLVRPENGNPGLAFAIDDRPVDRRRTAMQWQQARVELDAPVRWCGQRFVRDDLRHEGHHAEVGPQRPPPGETFVLLERVRWDAGQTRGLSGHPQRVGAPTFFRLGCAHSHDLHTVVPQAGEDRLTKRCLAHDRNAHRHPPGRLSAEAYTTTPLRGSTRECLGLHLALDF